MSFTRNGFGGLSLCLTLAGLGAQTLPLLSPEAGTQAPNLTPLKFELLERHLIVVRGAIGPLEGLKLLIDTGAIPSMVDRRVAKKLALLAQESEIVVFGQKNRSLTTVLPNIRVGPLHAQTVPAGVGDLSFLHGVDAIIGLDVLARSSFSIDYVEKRLTFGPVVASERSMGLDINPPFITVKLALGGRPLRLLVDTGSNRLVLFERRVRDRLPVMEVRGELVLYHLSGSSRLHRVFLPSIDAGGSNVERVEAFLSDAPMDGYPPGIDGVLGLRVLAGIRAGFDFERNRLTFN